MFKGYKVNTVEFQKFPYRLFCLMLLIRFVDLCWIQSSYVPDEYWQSLEVAHRKIFGYGHLTWEWTEGIRSYFYVSLVSLVFLILKYLHIDSPELVIILPRFLQGLISALSDVYFIRWVHEKRSGQYSWALICWITTFFISYCSTRTLVNTFEMNLTTFALYYYPWSPKSRSFIFITLISLLCFVRPTSVIVWFPLVIINIFTSRKKTASLSQYLLIGMLVAALNVILDSYFHGLLIFTPWNFFKFNVVNRISSYYGTHDILWYFYVGLPVVLGLQIFPFYYKTISRLWYFRQFCRSLLYDVEAQMILTVLWTVSVLSIVSHKEFRFLLPIVPMALYVSSGTLGKWSVKAKVSLLYLVGSVLIATNVSSLIFLGRFHIVGPTETMSNLRKDIGNSSDARLLFLAPCHSFPLYSHLHTKVITRFLTCMPDLSNSSNYMDEADVFYKEPRSWLKKELSTLQPCTLPTHIIQFDSLNITNFLYSNNYTLSVKVFNAFTYYPERTGEYVHIFKRKGKTCSV